MTELVTKEFLKEILYIFIVLILIVNILDILYPDLKDKILKKPTEHFKNRIKNKKRIVKFWKDVVNDE